MNADRRTFLPDNVRNFRRHIVVKHGCHPDRLREAGRHAPLCAVKGFAVFERRDRVRLRFHTQLNVAVDALGNFFGSCGNIFSGVHEMSGIAVVALQMIPLLFVVFADGIQHLRRKLIQLFFQR